MDFGVVETPRASGRNPVLLVICVLNVLEHKGGKRIIKHVFVGFEKRRTLNIESKLFGKPRIVGVDRRKKEEGTLSSLCTASMTKDEMTECRRKQHGFENFQFGRRKYCTQTLYETYLCTWPCSIQLWQLLVHSRGFPSP